MPQTIHISLNKASAEIFLRFVAIMWTKRSPVQVSIEEIHHGDTIVNREILTRFAMTGAPAHLFSYGMEYGRFIDRPVPELTPKQFSKVLELRQQRREMVEAFRKASRMARMSALKEQESRVPAFPGLY